MDEQINKMWPIYAMEYYSAMQRKEVQTPATTQIDLENSVVSERSQIQKATGCVIPFT